jgi:replicative superfamily II helicase
MVKQCPENYPEEQEKLFKPYFDWYPYPLHSFQKGSIEAIVLGHHSLVCAPTGSGKTLSGEFAIQYFQQAEGVTNAGKVRRKVIYTTPIKALSNEKYHQFTRKFPSLSVGLITGDIKINPGGDVLVMTTEILMNKLTQLPHNSSSSVTSQFNSRFDMDIHAELACVVFDEIHFINDAHRGTVWEQCIMQMPSHVQLVGLSATLDEPLKFAGWMERVSQEKEKGTETEGIEVGYCKKEVYYSSKRVRTVPLIHMQFITVNNGIYKEIKDKAVQSEIKKNTDCLHTIQTAAHGFYDEPYACIQRMLTLFDKHKIKVSRAHVLNKVSAHLVEKEMLPALVYVFSKKMLEQCAHEVTTNLLEFDSKIPYIVDAECAKLVRRLPNSDEFFHLPEYIQLVQLMRKGIGIHHAGMIPVLREITEIMFSNGFIKLLFCTETMSVGINLPVKTTIFTDICKFDGDGFRPLYSHEYTQASGRAGRLGLDTVGYCIHLNNLFRPIDSVSYRTMLNGKPQRISSKFRISYSFVLGQLQKDTDNKNTTAQLMQLLKNSMRSLEIDAQSCELTTAIRSHPVTPWVHEWSMEQVTQYIDLTHAVKYAVNRARKDAERELVARFPNGIKPEIMAEFKRATENETMRDTQIRQLHSLEHCMEAQLIFILTMLKNDGLILLNENESNELNEIELTELGVMAKDIHEMHAPSWVQLWPTLITLSAHQLLLILSCFASSSSSSSYLEEPFNADVCPDTTVRTHLIKLLESYQKYQDAECREGIFTGVDYSYNSSNMARMAQWAECQCDADCLSLFKDWKNGGDEGGKGGEKKGERGEGGEGLGVFAKSVLKMISMSNELDAIAQERGHVAFCMEISKMQRMLQKYVVTNQSLYVVL